MFTGLIQKVGLVHKAEKQGRDLRLTLTAPSFFKGVKLGDSVAVNGCCLTAVVVAPSRAAFQAVPETLKRTNMGGLKKGDRVNLEMPLRHLSRVGGHFVQGHVDGRAKVLEVRKEGGGARLRVRLPGKLSSQVVSKGSIALEGVSLTVAKVRVNAVEVALIPQTLKATTLGLKKSGDFLNVETDILVKYAAKMKKRGKSWNVNFKRTFK